MGFTIEGFEHFKSIFHPNLIANKDHYLKGGMYRFPPYHGCGLKNRNGTNKLIDYKRGQQCLFPTEKRYWKPYKTINKKTYSRKVKFTRYMSNLGINAYAKTKKRMWYDWDKKCYIPREQWFKNKDPFFEYDFNATCDIKESL